MEYKSTVPHDEPPPPYSEICPNNPPPGSVFSPTGSTAPGPPTYPAYDPYSVHSGESYPNYPTAWYPPHSGQTPQYPPLAQEQEVREPPPATIIRDAEELEPVEFDYMYAFAFFTLCFCNCPFGLLSLIATCMGHQKQKRGDLKGARRELKIAIFFALLGMALSLGVMALYAYLGGVPVENNINGTNVRNGAIFNRTDEIAYDTVTIVTPAYDYKP